jgi:hypothetical protein
MWTRDDWDRLARTLEARRGAMGYATFQAFINDRGINYRTAWDAEHAVARDPAKDRTNMRPATLDAIVDPAYGYVKGGGCRNILDGKEPELAPGTPGAPDLPAGGLPGFGRDDAALVAKFRAFLDWERAQGESERSA